MYLIGSIYVTFRNSRTLVSKNRRGGGAEMAQQREYLLLFQRTHIQFSVPMLQFQDL